MYEKWWNCKREIFKMYLRWSCQLCKMCARRESAFFLFFFAFFYIFLFVLGQTAKLQNWFPPSTSHFENVAVTLRVLTSIFSYKSSLACYLLITTHIYIESVLSCLCPTITQTPSDVQHKVVSTFKSTAKKEGKKKQNKKKTLWTFRSSNSVLQVKQTDSKC